MRNTVYAAVAACTGMLITSGIIALAVAAPEAEEMEAEAQVGELIELHWLESQQ